MELEQIAAAIRNARVQAGFTQKEVADTLGISQSYISRLEKRIMERLKKDLERVG